MRYITAKKEVISANQYLIESALQEGRVENVLINWKNKSNNFQAIQRSFRSKQE